jgi:hypothetical protein
LADLFTPAPDLFTPAPDLFTAALDLFTARAAKPRKCAPNSLLRVDPILASRAPTTDSHASALPQLAVIETCVIHHAG